MTTIVDQVASLESKLAAYESRKVPLSTTRLKEEYHGESHVGGLLAVARAALVAAESPAALGAAERAFVKADGSVWFGVRAAIRAAHDAAIEGGCGSARESDEVARLHARVETLEFEAKCRIEEARANHVERDDLRRQLDALTKPIDGVRELAVYGWRAAYGDRDCSFSTIEVEVAKAIASRVIGALRAAFIEACGHGAELYAQFFDAAVSSLKIEPAPPNSFEGMAEAARPPSAMLASTEPLKREADDAEQINWRPAVQAGQVWQYGPTGKHVTVERVGTTQASISPGGEITLQSDGRPYSPHWRLVSDAPFELPAPSDPSSRNEIALRDKIREIERRLVNLERAK